MKKEIHPKYQKTAVKCSCGNQFEVNSVASTLNIETCDKCHPFYTGEQKQGGSAGRVDKFNKKYGL